MSCVVDNGILWTLEVFVCINGLHRSLCEQKGLALLEWMDGKFYAIYYMPWQYLIKVATYKSYMKSMSPTSYYNNMK